MKHPGGRPRKELSGRIAQEPANGAYYTVEEAAELLGVHIHTLQARLRKGELAGKKISGHWRIYKNELMKGRKEQ
jgi:excisionase family DNA binding protein